VRSYPRLSFFSAASPSWIDPSGITASIPATSPRIVPQRSTCVPPALVETSPPIVALPRAPSVSGKRRPCSATASWSTCRITPASATASPACGSIARIRSSRRSDRISADPSAGGVAPPTIDVFPPCGTSATPQSRAAETIAATSAVEPGLSIAGACPCQRPRQSVSQAVIASRSVVIALGSICPRRRSSNAVCAGVMAAARLSRCRSPSNSWTVQAVSLEDAPA